MKEREKERLRERDRETKSQREREGERERKKNKRVRHILCYKLYKTLRGENITPKVSPRLLSILSNHTSHSIKQ